MELEKDQAEIVLQSDTGAISLSDLSRQISSEWLTTALSEKYPGVVVERSSIIRVVAGCSAKIWVKMAFNDVGRGAGLPTTMIVKSGFNRHDAMMLFTYEREMQAYRDVLPKYPINAPICYYAGESPDGLSSAIIMEDLTLKHVRFCHALQPLKFDEAAAFLTAQARFHSMTWNKQELVQGTSPFAKMSSAARVGHTAYFQSLVEPETWAHWATLPRGAAVPKALLDRERFVAAFERMFAFGETQPKAILMGDEHLGNLYIEADGTPGFLDFQSAFDPWCQGVTYFISNSLDVLDRRMWERDLLAHYLEQLNQNGVAAPTFEDAWDAYRKYLLFPFFVWLTNGTQFQTESVNTANCVRGAIAILDNDSFASLGM